MPVGASSPSCASTCGLVVTPSSVVHLLSGSPMGGSNTSGTFRLRRTLHRLLGVRLRHPPQFLPYQMFGTRVYFSAILQDTLFRLQDWFIHPRCHRQVAPLHLRFVPNQLGLTPSGRASQLVQRNTTGSRIQPTAACTAVPVTTFAAAAWVVAVRSSFGHTNV